MCVINVHTNMTSTTKLQFLSSAENEGWVDCISGTIITESLVRRIHTVNEMGMESQRLMIEKGHLCQLLYFPAAVPNEIWYIFSALSSLVSYVNIKIVIHKGS